jgi:hypothetical protein
MRADGETDSAYQARLAAVDGSSLIAQAGVEWQEVSGASASSATQSVSLIEQLPILTLQAAAPATLVPGQLVTLDLTVRNIGHGASGQVTARVTNPDGVERMVTAPAVVAGDTTVLHTTWVVPLLTKKGGESDGAYQARLMSEDGRAIAFPIALEWSDLAGSRYGVIDQTISAQLMALPIVKLALRGPDQAELGSQISYQVELSNLGHAAATIDLALMLPDGSLQRPDAGAALAPGEQRVIEVAFAVPSTGVAVPQPVEARVTWQDSYRLTYGPISASVQTTLPAPPTATPTNTPTETPSPTDIPTETPAPTSTPTNTPTETPTPPESPTATATASPTAMPSSDTGLRGYYYADRAFTDLRLVRIDPTVAFEWAEASPDASLPADGFAVRWRGNVTPPAAGTYTFFTEADDGVRLWVNGQPLIDDWDAPSLSEQQGHIDLPGGQPVAIELDLL